MKTRKLTIIAQDPSIKDFQGKILRAIAEIPYEKLSPGPRGMRVNVVDYDSSQKVLYDPLRLDNEIDLYEKASDSQLLNDPRFHSQNVYAIVMRLLARFENAFGRRIAWGNGFHQLNVSPHAFADPNAFYSDDAQGLFFGYFPKEDGGMVYTCLSHDIIAHEITHALLDGIRKTYTVPSYPDQAAFHEGFSDSIAILSFFGLSDVVKLLLSNKRKPNSYIHEDKLNLKSLKKNVLLGLAKEFGAEISKNTRESLRRSIQRTPSKNAIKDVFYQEPHIRGEILSAAILNSFLEVWIKRLKSWLPGKGEKVLIDRVVEDATDAADHLLTMCIRALDYCPVVDISFDDFLSSLLTADMELIIDDGRYKYRDILRKQFARWGIGFVNSKANSCARDATGMWRRFDPGKKLNYDVVHLASLKSDPTEAFRFLWENREVLNIYEHAFTQIISLRNCVRVAPDGFVLNETVCEYKQSIELEASRLKSIHPQMEIPDKMPASTEIKLIGGGVMIFDEYGHLKYHICSGIDDPDRQNMKLKYLWKNGIKDSSGRYGFSDGSPRGRRFSHQVFGQENMINSKEGWN